MKAFIKYISYYLPKKQFTNQEIENLFPEWDGAKIVSKIGIKTRHISDKDQTTSDLGVAAIENLCAEYKIDKKNIDYLIVCTQSPDYFLPTTACVIQNNAGLPKSCAALDINQGCSGYVYALSLAKGLVVSGIAKNVIVVTAESYSKFIHPDDKGNRSIFGDASSVTLISDNGLYEIENFVLGSDGSGYENLIVRNGASKNIKTSSENDPDNFLFMDGPAIFKFTIDSVPQLVKDTLIKNNATLEDIEQFIFHQANTYMLDFLRKRIKIPTEKFIIDMEDYGNTVSSTIPIVLKNLISKKQNEDKLLLAGFGVGYSWGAVCLKKHAND